MQLMGLLQKLMRFCFYTTAKQMTGVMRPLLDALDDRQLMVHDSGSPHHSKMTKRAGSHGHSKVTRAVTRLIYHRVNTPLSSSPSLAPLKQTIPRPSTPFQPSLSPGGPRGATLAGGRSRRRGHTGCLGVRR